MASLMAPTAARQPAPAVRLQPGLTTTAGPQPIGAAQVRPPPPRRSSFSRPTAARRTSLTITAASSASVVAPVVSRPARVVPPTLPRVYVYDHCPFCVRVRLALGYKNVKHEVVFLANDDVNTPMSLVGKKVAPILECKDVFEQPLIMMESLDIIDYFDSNEKYGPTGAIAPKSPRTDIKEWMKSVQSLLRLLHRPRYMMASLPEFQQQDSRDYFVAGHQLPPFDKQTWKGGLPLLWKWGKYEDAYNQTPKLLPELNAKLQELERLIHCEDFCTEGYGFSYDDIDLWSRLRSLTLVKGAEFGPKTRAYIDNLSQVCDVPTYDCMAL